MKFLLGYNRGFTLLEIMLVVSVIALLAAIGIPNYLHASRTSQTNSCIGNLRKIYGAKEQWALEMGKTTTEVPVGGDLAPYLARGVVSSLAGIYCPISGEGELNGYALNAVGSPPQC